MTPAPPTSTQPPEKPVPAPATRGFFRVVATVLSAFIGIRKRESAETAHQSIKPAQVIVAGIIGALCFIAILVMLVRFIISR